MNSLLWSPLATPCTPSPLLRTNHLPCSARLRVPRARSAVSLSAVHPNPCGASPLLPPLSSSNGRKIGRSKGELPLGGGGGGCGGGGSGSGGGRSGKPGSGNEDDRSGEGFRLLKWLLRRLLQLGVKGPLIAGDILATMHSWVSISAEEKQTPYFNSMNEITEMEDEESHGYGSIDDQIKEMKRLYSDRTAEVGTRTTNSQDHNVDGDISDDETLLDDNKQMEAGSQQKNQIRLQSRKKKNQILQSRKKKRQRLQSRKNLEGTRSQVSNTANALYLGALALLPYWDTCCKDPTLKISKRWKDALFIAYIYLVSIAIIVSAHSSRFKDAKLPVNDGFKLLEVVQFLLFLFFFVAAFIAQHVCRGVSISVICPCIGVLLIIVMAFGTEFQKKMAFKCIKVPCQMVIKCIVVPLEMLIKCIKAKFKNMPEEKISPGLPMEPV